jgi:hypothetical protein
MGGENYQRCSAGSGFKSEAKLSNLKLIRCDSKDFYRANFSVRHWGRRHGPLSPKDASPC